MGFIIDNINEDILPLFSLQFVRLGEVKQESIPDLIIELTP